ncbi:MAG: T9SS type A sorting domain-containing protein [bacterium]|nr:T9SS type A sorting domain-containing protein [bacterium]
MGNGEIDREAYNTFDECIAILMPPTERTISNKCYMGKRNLNNFFEQNALIKPMSVFNLYPNPATSQLNIAFKASGFGNFTVELFDILGNREILINKDSEKDNHFAVEIDKLSAGSYFFKTSVDGLTRMDRFIIAK